MSEHWSAAQYRAYAASQGQPATAAAGATAPVRRGQPEYDEQVRFFALVEVLSERHPTAANDLLDVFATSSGGARDRRTAGQLKEAGQRRGVPDIEAWIPRGGFHGLAIELKPVAVGRATPEQRSRLARLGARGYRAQLCHGWVSAGRVLCDYLGLPWPDDAEIAVESLLALRVIGRKAARKARRRYAGLSLPTTLPPG